MASAPGEIVTKMIAAYGADLRRFIVSRLRVGDEADDLAQEVFMRLTKQQRKEPIEEPLAFMHHVAKQVAWKYHNKALKRPFSTDHEMLEQLALQGQSSPVDEMTRREHQEREWDRYMGLLEATHQEVLDLKYREGLKNKEIAAKLKISRWTVKRYLVQAKKTLKEHRTRGLE